MADGNEIASGTDHTDDIALLYPRFYLLDGP